MLLNYQEKITLTGENLDQTLAALQIRAADQVREIRRLVAENGQTTISHYPFTFAPGDQRGDLTVFHDLGRGAIAFGDHSRWGTWDDHMETLHLDDGEQYNYDGTPVDQGDDGACSLGNV